MDSKLLYYFIFLFLLFTAKVQSMDPHEVEMVVEIKNFNASKHLPLLENLIEATSPNIMVIASCEQKGWVVFKIIEQKFNVNDQIELLMKASGLDFIIKEGATKKDVSIACNEPVYKF
ncbi:MAG: hypothetical protein IPO63_00980 [Bacteroidetes bacterium]|nr:hypothetical protein [Bacteroidota bacterium]